jgi:hypothetical protein
MDLDNLMAELEHLTAEQFMYLGLAAMFGPFVVKLLGFKILAPLVRPLALLVLVGGLYAKQERAAQGDQG